MAVEFYPLTKPQTDFLNELYYQKKMLFGRDKLYRYISKNHPEQKITRRQVADYLANQEVSQLFRQKPSVKASRPLITARKTLQIDLMDMTQYSPRNRNYSYILNCVDTFSRKMWAFKLLTKTNTSVKAFVIPLLLQNNFKVLSSDNGKEFKGFETELTRIGVKHIFGNAYTPTNQSIVERSNGTLKRMIYKMFHIRNSKRWTDILDELVDNYNNTTNRNLDGKSPNEVFNASVEEQDSLQARNKERIRKALRYADDKELPIGTLVRIVNNKPKRQKSQENWSNDIYRIIKVINPKDNTLTRRRYQLFDINNEFVLKGNYNITQLQQISKSVRAIPLKPSRAPNTNIRRIDQREIDALNFENRQLTDRRLRPRL